MKTIIFQSAKLGDIQPIIDEFRWAQTLFNHNLPVERVYGVSGGSLVALAFALQKSAIIAPDIWGKAYKSLDEISNFIQNAKSSQIRSLNCNPSYGFFNLLPLRKFLENKLYEYTGSKNSYKFPDQLLLSDLSFPCYICCADKDGTLKLFGKPNKSFKFQYHHVQIGPPEDASIIDSVIAALSTMLSTKPEFITNNWYRDCRPAVVDAGAIIASVQDSRPEDLVRRKPYAPIRSWNQNWFTSSFIMHSQNERNQTILASYYLDLLSRHQELLNKYQTLVTEIKNNPSLVISTHQRQVDSNELNCFHIDLPYLGSTEASTNMRQSVENKEELLEKFQIILNPQLSCIPFDKPTNVIYGAGGFSGILGGLISTRAVDDGFNRNGGEIINVYGVSAGVLNGFFHAVQLAAYRFPDIYKPSARTALADLETFISTLNPGKIARVNINPSRLWKGFANLSPLECFLSNCLGKYTGSKYPDQITFDDIGLPMTVSAARLDGYTEFFGTTTPERKFIFNEREWQVISAPIIKSIIAGWSMNTYITPTQLNGQTYTDGGGSFYDIGLFVALFDANLINLLNIHLDEPEGHSYGLPPKPNLIRIIFDTHNYYFPEERRRMRLLTNLLYQYYILRSKYQSLMVVSPNNFLNLYCLPQDFRKNWRLMNE